MWSFMGQFGSCFWISNPVTLEGLMLGVLRAAPRWD